MKIEITNSTVKVYTMGKTITVSLTTSQRITQGCLVSVDDRLTPEKPTEIIR